jgi:hypothetical protein
MPARKSFSRRSRTGSRSAGRNRPSRPITRATMTLLPARRSPPSSRRREPRH